MLKATTTALLAISAVGAVDPYSSADLQMAVDSAMMELHATQGWFHGLRVSTGYPEAMSVASCTPDATKWIYPPQSSATGLLARVLETGVLKVAGVQWVKAGAADYKSDPLNPTGFWPEYLNAIVQKMSAAYGLTITIERVYYADSRLVLAEVESGENVDMSEPYYYIAGFHLNTPRIESHGFSCVTAGLASAFYTVKGSGVNNVDLLYDKLAAGPNRAVGFIGQGNFDAVSSMLPASTTPSFTTNSSDIAANVMNGAYVAGYISEGAPPHADKFDIFETGIISPRTILFRKEQVDPYSPPSSPPMDTVENDTVGILVALIVVSCITLVMALLLSFVICKERQGSPLFVPLVSSGPVESTGTKPSV